MLLEERIDVVSVAITGNYAIPNRLEETRHLPGCSATFRVTDQTFLCYDGDGIAWGTVKCLQDRVPHIRLVFLIGLSAGTMDGKNTNVVGSEAPDGKCAAERSNARVCAFRALYKHAIGGEDIFLLTICLGLKISDAAREEVGIHGFAFAPTDFQFLFQLFLLESKPVSDLSPSEGDLTSTVANVKDWRWMFGLDFTCDAKRTATRSRDGTTSFVTTG